MKMTFSIKRKNSQKTSLIYIILFLLVFMNKLTNIYIFSKMSLLDTFINVIQIPLYFGLIYIIAQKSYSLKELCSFSTVGVLLLIGYIVSGQAAYFRGFLLVIAVKNIPYVLCGFVCTGII